MNTWYATKELMHFIESLGKVYYCPVRSNRTVGDSFAQLPFRHVACLDWTEQELAVDSGQYAVRLIAHLHWPQACRTITSTPWR